MTSGVLVRARTVADPYSPEANSETFDLGGYLAQFDSTVLSDPKYTAVRVELTRCDPLLFALTYLRHHISDPDTGLVSLADCHLDWLRTMLEWTVPDPGLRGSRHSFTSPRDSGKSTWWYTVAPLWAGAHGHAKFVAAFADSGTQAEMHLQTFRSEAQHNRRLRRDFYEMCVPARKPTGKTVSDNEGMFQSRNGFVFAARGIGTASLGMKVGTQRPDVLILDDIEKDESSYGDTIIEKRLTTLVDAVFPLNERARVVIVGTVTRPGSLIHQLVKAARGEGDTESWITDERITPHYYPPVVTRDDGTKRSIWPERWSLEYLLSICHTRSYAKNYANDPRTYDGDLWSDDDFRYGDPPGPVTRWFMWVDPPTTTNQKSDWAGVAIVGFAPSLSEEEDAVVVWDAWETPMTGRKLGNQLGAYLHAFSGETDRRVLAVIVESNQGGELWLEVFDDLPCPVKIYTASEPKPVRFAKALERYQAGRVYHRQELPTVESRMLTYPRVRRDDIIDAVASGVLRLTAPAPVRKQSKTQYQRRPATAR